MGDQTINPNGAALKRTRNLADLNDAPTARANIGHSVAPRAVVGPPGSADVTHTSIQAAHDDLEASGGGLIHVRAGTYTEDLIWTDSTLHLRGEASHGGVAVVGEATFEIGIDGDASTSHQIEVSNIIFTPAADQVAPVVSVSGDPARVWFRNCRFWATDEACDALSVDVADGLVGLEGCHVWNDTGATGTPLAVNGGTVKLGPGCAIDHGDLGYAIDVVGGAVWCPAVDLDITGRVRNLSVGNGSFAIFLKGCAITAPDASAFTCDGAGAVILGQLAVTSAGAGGNPVAEGNGAFVWAPDVTSMTQAANPLDAGHTAPAATLNAALGPIAVRTAGYLGISAAGIPYTPAVDGDWEDPNPANVGSALDALAAGAGGGGGGGSQTMAPPAIESFIPVPVLGDLSDMTTFGASTALAASTTLADGSLLLQAPDTDDVQTGLGIAVGAGDWTYGAAIGLQYDGAQYNQTYTIRASITFSGDPADAHVAMGIGNSNSRLNWEGVALTTNSTQAVNWDGWPAHSTRRPQSGRGHSGTVVLARRGSDIHVFYADPGAATLIRLETQSCPVAGGAGVIGLTLTNRGSEWNAVKAAAVKMQVHRFGAMAQVPGWDI